MPPATIWSPADVRSVATDRLKIFALVGSQDLGHAVARLIGQELARHEERDFEDGEHKARPLEPVAGADVYVIHSLHGGPDGSANDKLCRLLFFIGALKDAGAARVTAVTPYLCYARKDRRTKALDPVITRYVAGLFEAMGTDAVVALDVHNETAFENAFRLPTVALSAAPLLVRHLAAGLATEPLCVVSPDLGGGKRADLFREVLEAVTGRAAGKAFAEKRRSGGIVSGDLFVGEVAGATCIIVDDLVSTGGTLARAAKAARAGGARSVIACVTHGLFMPGAETALADPAIDRVVSSDSVPPFRLPQGPVRDKLDVVPVAPLIAEAIARLHTGQALADLFVY